MQVLLPWCKYERRNVFFAKGRMNAECFWTYSIFLEYFITQAKNKTELEKTKRSRAQRMQLNLLLETNNFSQTII